MTLDQYAAQLEEMRGAREAIASEEEPIRLHAARVARGQIQSALWRPWATERAQQIAGEYTAFIDEIEAEREKSGLPIV